MPGTIHAEARLRLFWRLLKIDPSTTEGRRLVAFLGLTFCAGILGGPVSSLLSIYVDSQLRQPPTFTSTLLAFQLAMTGVFAVVSGVVADGLGQKRTLLLGLVGLPLASAVFILHSFWILAGVVLSLGMTNALQTIGGQSYLLAAAPRAKLGGLTALYFLGNTLGGAVGNAIAGPAADRWGFTIVGIGGLALSLVLLAITLVLLPEAAVAPESRRARPLELLVAYGQLMRRRQIVLVGVIRFLPTCFYGTTSLLIPLLVYRLSHSVAVASLYATASLLLSTTAQQIVGRVIDRVGPFGPVRILTGFLPIVAFLTALATENLPALILAGLGATATLWCISTTIPPLVREVSPVASQGRALGLVHLIWSSGMLIGTITAGPFVIISSHLPFALFAACSVLAFPAAMALRRFIPAITDRVVETAG